MADDIAAQDAGPGLVLNLRPYECEPLTQTDVQSEARI